MTDQEIIKGLDPDACLHEAIDIKSPYQRAATAECSCGNWEGLLIDFLTHVDRSGGNITFDTDFMLKKLMERDCEVRFNYLINTPHRHVKVQIAFKEQGWRCVGSETASTHFQALRGAVVELIKEEVVDEQA